MQIGIRIGIPMQQQPPSGGAAPSTAGQPIGLLLILTKAS